MFAVLQYSEDTEMLRKTHLSVTLALKLAFAGTAIAGTPKPATRDLLDANPGMRVRFEGERQTALYGKPFATDSDPETTTDQFVESFLSAHGEALGVDSPSFGLVHKHVARSGKFTFYTYQQEIESLPVYSSVVKIPVLNGTTEKIGYIGTNLFEPPASPLPSDVLSAQDAIDSIAQSAKYSHLSFFSEADRVIFPSDEYMLHRTWMFEGADEDEGYRFFVDTEDGTLVGVLNMVLAADVSGVVSAKATPCCAYALGPPTCPSGSCPAEYNPPSGCEPELVCETPDPGDSCCCGSDNPANPCTPNPGSIPLIGAQVTAYADVPPDCSASPETGTIIAQTFTDELGEYILTGIDLPVRVAARLNGERLFVTNCNGASSCDGEELLACAEVVATPSGPIDLQLNSTPTEYDTAQANAFVYSKLTFDWFAGYAPISFGAADAPAEVFVNVSGSCNGYYNQVTNALSFFRSSSECRNTAFSTFVAHEFGHRLVLSLVPIFYTFPCGFTNGGFHEGVADAMASLSLNTECIFYDVEDDTANACSRNLSTTTVPLEQCGLGTHLEGEALGGAFWKTREALIETFAEDPVPEAIAKSVIDPLFVDFLFITDGLLDQSIVIEVLASDDDDADLSNGTPHYSEIVAGFVEAHGWSEPMECDELSSVIVSWDGPIGNPIEGADYSVLCEVDPPNVILRTTESGGIPVARWILGRGMGILGSHELGTVSAEWLPPTTYDIIVQIGSIVPPLVSNVDVVDIEPQSQSNWSNIELSLTGDIKARVQCYSNANDEGGSLSGVVAGSARTIIANRIGTGASNGGALQCAGAAREITIDYVPTDSDLELSSLEREMRINYDMQGPISIGGIYATDVTTIGSLNGRLNYVGSTASNSSITVSDGLFGGDILIGEGFAGSLNVKGMAKFSETQDKTPLVRVGGLTGTITVTDATSDFVGTIEVGTGQSPADVGDSGLIDIRSPLGEDATIVVHGDVAPAGKIWVLNGSNEASSSVQVDNLYGTIQVGDSMAVPPVAPVMAGTLDILGDVTSSGKIDFAGTFNGDMLIGGDLVGDIEGTTMNGVIDVAGQMASTGSIDLNTLNGYIGIGENTARGSRVDVSYTFGSGAAIEINTSRGLHNAEGIVQVGPTGYQGPIYFDGALRMYNGPAGGGVLDGFILVYGCHATDDDLDICICGGLGAGKIKIYQTGCSPQVSGWGGECLCY